MARHFDRVPGAGCIHRLLQRWICHPAAIVDLRVTRPLIRAQVIVISQGTFFSIDVLNDNGRRNTGVDSDGALGQVVAVRRKGWIPRDLGAGVDEPIASRVETVPVPQHALKRGGVSRGHGNAHRLTDEDRIGQCDAAIRGCYDSDLHDINSITGTFVVGEGIVVKFDNASPNMEATAISEGGIIHNNVIVQCDPLNRVEFEAAAQLIRVVVMYQIAGDLGTVAPLAQ